MEAGLEKCNRIIGMRRLSILTAALTFCALAAAPAYAYIANDRWERTATDGFIGPMGTPATVTWSFAPDGTTIPGAASNLINFLDVNFGAGAGGADLTQRPWFWIFDQSLARLSALSGITYVYEPHDDAAGFSNVFSLGGGVLGVRGDVRLAGKSYGPGDNTLASNFFPDYGDMMINTDQVAYLTNSASNYRRFRNTLMHEQMHGMGVSHVSSSNAAFLIEPTLGTSFDGPQLDDILAMQRLYGDVLEKNGGNDAPLAATPLGVLAVGEPLVRGTLGDSTAVAGTAVDFLSIDDDSDVDFFQFSLAEPLEVSLALTPKGATYQIGPVNEPQASYNTRALNDLSLALFDASGSLQMASSNAFGFGFGETLNRELQAGSYLVRVTGSADDVQLYQIALNATPPGADALTWVGSSPGGIWNVDATANFHDGITADVFRNGDAVTFDASASTTSVTVVQPVSPASMTVQSAANYTFSGVGSITVQQLTVGGGGTVELANLGNALADVTVVDSGLVISGFGNAPIAGSINVNDGATLELVGNQAFGATSTIAGRGLVVGNLTTPGTISPGDLTGTLQVDGNVVFEASSALAIEIGGLLAGENHDVLSVAGSATLAGELAVSFVNGFQPTAGAAFSILNADSVIGQFADLSLPSLSGGLVWNTSYFSTSMLLSVSAAVAYDPADFNEDGLVDAADLVIWRTGFGMASGAGRHDGDANGDGAVNGADWLLWQQGLSHSGNANVAGASVPEPAAWILAVAAMAVRWARPPRR
jgi:hypothetical protein